VRPYWLLYFHSAILISMKGLTDTHAHLCDPVFDPDRLLVLERARRAGVSRIIAVSENLADAEKNLALADKNPMIRPAAGLYPTNLDLAQASEMVDFIRIHADRLSAIGEVGLDYWKVQEESGREMQREIFRGFIDLSLELGIPLNVHSRSAGRHAVEFLLRHSAAKVQLHAFDGKTASALPALEAGYFFSIPPSIVRSGQKRKLASKLPLSNILIETDSPVLGPVSGDRNEPANAWIAVKTIAELKGLPEEAVAEAVGENAFRLYGEKLP
ncbi:MAG: TatD family hydrolase, partial [Acidobacteria bacterium]|nr:TatD family hydrolase [Acidobacteriota bacterium]